MQEAEEDQKTMGDPSGVGPATLQNGRVSKPEGTRAGILVSMAAIVSAATTANTPLPTAVAPTSASSHSRIQAREAARSALEVEGK